MCEAHLYTQESQALDSELSMTVNFGEPCAARLGTHRELSSWRHSFPALAVGWLQCASPKCNWEAIKGGPSLDSMHLHLMFSEHDVRMFCAAPMPKAGMIRWVVLAMSLRAYLGPQCRGMLDSKERQIPEFQTFGSKS